MKAPFPPPRAGQAEDSVPSADAQETQTDTQYNRCEALRWLSGNKNPHAFASTRFDNTQAAVDYVAQLYDMGATLVDITDIYSDPDRIKSEGGPYADVLIVHLPGDSARRNSIMTVYRREVSLFGCNNGDEASSVYGDEIVMWWD